MGYTPVLERLFPATFDCMYTVADQDLLQMYPYAKGVRFYRMLFCGDMFSTTYSPVTQTRREKRQTDLERAGLVAQLILFADLHAQPLLKISLKKLIEYALRDESALVVRTNTTCPFADGIVVEDTGPREKDEVFTVYANVKKMLYVPAAAELRVRSKGIQKFCVNSEACEEVSDGWETCILQCCWQGREPVIEA